MMQRRKKHLQAGGKANVLSCHEVALDQQPPHRLRGLKEPTWNVSKNLKGNKFKVATDHKKTKGHELTDLQVSNSCPQGLLLDAFPTHRSELT